MNLRTILLSMAASAVMAMSAAVIPDIKFRRLDTRDGLSNSQVLCIYRDTKGFVWIGTPYGLNRYVGYRMKTYYSSMRDTTTLRSNYVDAIYEDELGRLWLKQGMGYSLFDPKTEKCNRHPERLFEPLGVTGGIEFLHIDKKQEFWIKSYRDGFFHYRPQTKTLKRFAFGFSDQEIPQEMGVSSITEDSTTVYMSSTDGEIICFDREKDVISRKVDYLKKNGLTRDQDCKLKMDRSGRLWVITTPTTYMWNPKTDQWIHSIQSALRSLGFQNLPEEMEVWDIETDDRQRLWIATDHGGLFVATGDGMDIKQFLTSKYDDTTLSDNTLRNIYIDSEKRVWIGSYMNGVNLFASNTSSFRNLELGVINTVCYDTKSGHTWLGTNDAGIMRYNSESGEIIRYNKENSGIGSNTMVGSLVASDGSVWFGTYEGGLIHIKDGHVTNYKALANDTTGLSTNNIWTVCEDQWKNIWIGTLGGGVQRIDKRTGKMRTFRISNSNLPSDYISSITMTKKGWLLVAHSKYLSLINPKTYKIINFDITKNEDGIPITEMSIMAMEDSRGLLWQGSSAGATVWDMKQNKVYLIDMRAGLLSSTVNGIVEDDKHTMWVVTDRGISNIIVQQQEDGQYTFIVNSYNSRDGLQDATYNQRSICYTSRGLVLVGGQGGLDVLNPKNLGKGRMNEMPLFSGLQLFDQDVPIGERIDGRLILEQALNDSEELSLLYGDQFTIQLASSSGEVRNRSRFVYKLEGFNDNWVKTSELNPNISYMSLRYGDYTLRVRMLNADGTMGEQERTLDIHISAPLWRTRWMIVLYMLLIAAAAWWWRRRFMKRQQERLELERLRMETEKKHWISEMRKQLMAEVQQKAQEAGLDADILQEDDDGPKMVMTDLVPLFREVCDKFEAPNDKTIKLSFFPIVDHLEIMANRQQMQQLLQILLENAANFSPNKSKVKVFVEKHQGKGILRVVDSGIGLPNDVRPHLFEQIVGDDDNPRLHMVFDIVLSHGGTVRAEDNPGGGTVFIIEFPCDPEEEVIEEAVIIEDE